jgi:hypothetical protein
VLHALRKQANGETAASAKKTKTMAVEIVPDASVMIVGNEPALLLNTKRSVAGEGAGCTGR